MTGEEALGQREQQVLLRFYTVEFIETIIMKFFTGLAFK